MIVPMIGFGQWECISGDCENGYGTSSDTESTWSYTGSFRDGLPNGVGEMSWMWDEWDDNDDEIWGYFFERGYYYDGKLDGYGTTQKRELIIEDNERYSYEVWTHMGEYKDGKWNGYGLLKRVDESGYFGYWVNGDLLKTISKF